MAYENLPNQQQIDSLIATFEVAQARLEASVERALASKSMGTARYRRQQLALINEKLNELRKQVNGKAPKLIADAYGFGVKIVQPESSLKASLGAGIHAEAIKVLTANMVNGLDDSITIVGRRINDMFRREGLRQTAINLAEGATAREGARALAEALRRKGVTSFTDRAGRHWGLDTYASMVIRTTTREAATEGTKHRMLELDYDLVKISRHKHPHDICSEFEGRVFSLTGKTPDYPVIKQLPPFHPNCRHVATPARENFGFAPNGEEAVAA